MLKKEKKEKIHVGANYYEQFGIIIISDIFPVVYAFQKFKWGNTMLIFYNGLLFYLTINHK